MASTMNQISGTINFQTASGGTTPLVWNSRMFITNVGDIGIGTTAPGGLFELSLNEGRKPISSTWTITSDARLKNIEGVYTKGLKEILQLKPITYHYKNVGERKFKDEVINTLGVGYSAQDVQKIFPEAVGMDPDGYLNFDMHSILVAYTNAIKELNQKIEDQQKGMESQENKNAEQQKLIEEQQKTILQLKDSVEKILQEIEALKKK